ncbi:MAG: hypothetical protein LBF93_07385 [Zoogloeaceae bacterium]|jgi:tetratricopeptide (TPR) repeat protein|nr:hypothetical protein [Zoogloeaceae bacterium]
MMSDATPLCGVELEIFMNRLENEMGERMASGDPREIDLRARLLARPLRADSLEAIGRLHTLWMWAGDAKAAMDEIETDGAALLAAIPVEEQADAKMTLALFRLEVAEHFADEAAMRAGIAEARLLSEAPGLRVAWHLHNPVLSRLMRCPPDIALEASHLCRELEARLSRQESRADCDTARFFIRNARIQADSHEMEAARAAGAEAVAALRAATDKSDVKLEHWLQAGDALIEFAPEQLETIRSAVLALGKSCSLPQQRQVEVRLARLAARARYALCDLEGALAGCEAARYSLAASGGYADDFIEYELPWLMEADYREKAGQRAFFHIYFLGATTEGMREWVLRLVHERLADATDTSVWWPLCVMRAAQAFGNLEKLLSVAPKEALGEISAVHQAIFGTLKMTDWDALTVKTRTETLSSLEALSPLTALKDRVFAAARNLAESRSPRHPWVRRLVALQDKEMERTDASTALMQLEVAIREGVIQDAWTLIALMRLRLEVLGLAEAFQRPLPPIHNGMALYGLAQALPEMLEKDFIMERTVLDDQEQAELDRLSLAMQRALYEQGKARMEVYFRTGKGHPHEGNPHLYSLLCNSLAVLYRADGRYSDAIALHRLGIAASPFAEHYQGILDCYWNLNDNDNIVEAAERLWHYAASYGYGRHDPNLYAGRVAKALYRLERDKEIAVWLKRLLSWQRKNGAGKEKLEKRLPNEFLRARLEVACYMFRVHADKCMALWRRIKTQVDASEDAMVHAASGDLMHGCKQYAQAIPHYERALELNRARGSDRDETLEEAILKRLEDYRAQIGTKTGNKPWWKVW